MNEKQGNCGPTGPQIKKLHNTKSSSNFIFFGCTFFAKQCQSKSPEANILGYIRIRPNLIKYIFV